jgi:hypothetical protein
MQRRSSVALVLIVLVAMLAGTSAIVAQDAPPQVGDDITFIDPDGIIRGTVAVRELADPFTDFDPNYPPEPGVRYVVLTVTFQAALDQTLEARPAEIMLQTTDGRLYESTYVPRPGDSPIPDLQSQDLAPDNRISGIVAYKVPEDGIVSRILYQPTYDRLIELAEVSPGAGPAPGEAISYTNQEGATAAISTEVIDPFQEFYPGYPPEEGYRFVMLHPVFENSGQLPYPEDPYDFYVTDAEGFMYGTSSSVYANEPYSVAPLESQTMSPGDRVSGLLGYIVPADARLTSVVYWPESARIVTVADLEGGGQTPPSEPEPAPSVAPVETSESLVVASPTPDPSAGTLR